MTEGFKRGLVATAALALLAASCAWIYSTQTVDRKLNVALRQRVGEVMASKPPRSSGAAARW